MRKHRLGPRRLASSALFALQLVACGPSELPAFANPPPDNAQDAAAPTDDTDAGEPGRDG